MRRTSALATVALATALSVLPAAATFAADGTSGAASRPQPRSVQLPEAAAQQAFQTAVRVLDGGARAGDPDATLALRDLRLALPRLSGTERDRAEALLARPTQGAGDPLGDGYTSPSKKTCSKHVCVHWVSATDDSDRATRAWVDQTMKRLKQVWKLEVGKLGYRKPRPDKGRGGNDKLDVYLKDVGAAGLYGYCAPEKPERKRYPFVHFGYCVLDNDFAPTQFGGVPALNSLKVTAAHEFFHAVQFAYDFGEDPWFMESTATWMEERYADGVNDNRQYLPYSQLVKPQEPLDTFNTGSFNQYGNWVWWEYVTSRWGRGLVRSAWEKAGAYSRASKDMYSTKATTAVLKSHGGFPTTFGSFASGNLTPGKTYAEGAEWGLSPQIADTQTLSLTTQQVSGSQTLDHMAARHVRFQSSASLVGLWKLRVEVNGPWAASSPVAKLLITRTNGTTATKTISLNKKGDGARTVPFSFENVQSVTLTLVNASTRFSCGGGEWSCDGTPKDDGKTFGYTAKVLPI